VGGKAGQPHDPQRAIRRGEATSGSGKKLEEDGSVKLVLVEEAR